MSLGPLPIPALNRTSHHMVLLISILLILYFTPLSSGATTLSTDIISATSGSTRYTIDSEWGAFGDRPGEIDSIDDILLTRDGRVYVSDAGNHRVSIYSRNRTYLNTIGGWVNETGFLFTPGNLAEDTNGTIYITDSAAPRINLYSAGGVREQSINLPEKPGFQFFGPKGIAINSSGIIYVTEPADHTVRAYSDGGIPGQILSLPVQSGKNPYPGPMAFDTEDNLFVIDSGSGHLLRYDPRGNLTADRSPEDIGFIGGEIPYDLCMGPDGNLYLTALYSNSIQVITTRGEMIGREIIPVSGIQSPRIAFSTAGEIYIGDSSRHHIYRILKTSVSSEDEDQNITSHVQVNLRVSPDDSMDHPVIHVEPEKITIPGLNFPGHIMVTGNGNIYISSHNNHRVVCTRNQGTLIRVIDNSSIPDGRFYNPGGIAEDASGNLYIANQGYGRIEVFSSSGTYLSSIGSHGTGLGEFNRPSGLAFGPDGTLYVADLGNNRIVRLSKTGKLMTMWGSVGINEGEFREPWGVAIGRDGSVYVTDSQNNRVQKFTPDGRWLRTWGRKGNEPGTFLIPAGIQVDEQGNILVVDINNKRIQVFTPDGDLVQEILPEKTGWASYLRMQGLALSSSGDFYITDATSTGSVLKLTGTLIQDAEKKNGDVYVRLNSDLLRNLILRLCKITPGREAEINDLIQSVSNFISDAGNEDQDNPPLTSYSISGSWENSSTSSGSGMKPAGITTGPDGRIYVADYGNHRIRVFSPDGTPAFSWGEKGSGECQFYNPADIAIDTSGNVYVADTNNHRVQKFTSNGSFIRQWPIPARNQTHLCRPTGICVDEEGTIFVTDYANYQIYRFAPDGTEQYHWGVQGTIGGHLMGPYGIAVNDHQVYITDMLSPGVKVYDDQGNFITSWNKNDSFDGALNEPQGISIDLEGMIFVADRADNRIIRYSPQGQVLSAWENHPSSGLISPTDVWPLPDGTILVSDFGNGRIVKMIATPVRQDESLSDQYWKFSKSMDDWWNRTWSEINSWE